MQHDVNVDHSETASEKERNDLMLKPSLFRCPLPALHRPVTLGPTSPCFALVCPLIHEPQVVYFARSHDMGAGMSFPPPLLHRASWPPHNVIFRQDLREMVASVVTETMRNRRSYRNFLRHGSSIPSPYDSSCRLAHEGGASQREGLRSAKDPCSDRAQCCRLRASDVSATINSLLSKGTRAWRSA